MKFSLNDKRVFIVLGFLGVAVIYYNFFYLSQQKEIKKYTERILAYEEASVDNNALASAVSGIDTEIKILNEKIKSIRSTFPPEISQKDVLILLRRFSEESGFEVNSITFSEIKEVSGSIAQSITTDTPPEDASGAEAAEDEAEASDINADGEEATSTDFSSDPVSFIIKDKRFLNALSLFGIDYGETIIPEITKNGVEDGKGYSFGVNINGKSKNKQLKDFISKLQTFKCMTSIGNIQINSDNEGLLTVAMQINFYGIADRKAAQQGNYFDVDWVPLDSAGKNNIFEPYEAYNVTSNAAGGLGDTINNASGSSQEQKVDYDFSMRVLSFGNNMTPPTVTLLGKSIVADKSVTPIVYGDNNKIENVELYLENKGGKFYCKFKTDHQSFPEAKYLNLAQFEPKGDEIKMLIDSSKRVSTSDVAGVSMKITNKTNKKLVIDVENEDNNRPRVAITKDGNNVIINYK